MDDKEREKASTDVAKFMNAPGMCNIIFWDSFYKRMNPALPSIRYEWLSFQYLLLSEIFFHVEGNGILVEYACSFLRLIFNTAQLRLLSLHNLA